MDRALIQEVANGEGWLPAWAGAGPAGFHVEWCLAGTHPLREPFYQDSLNRLMRLPVNHFLRHRTEIDALEQLQRRRRGLRPNGFIFHTSRCGSTLVAQMLASIAGTVVLAEPQPLDAVLGATDPESGELHPRRAEWVEWMLGALGQPRCAGDRRLFVKFDAWHVTQLPMLRRLFPDVPWVFLYRDPREVLASHLSQPGAFLLPRSVGGRAFSSLAAVDGGTLAERVVANLRRWYAAVLASLPTGGGMLFNYRDLPGAVLDTMSGHFRLDLTASDRAAMAAASMNDAKMPYLPYDAAARGSATLSPEHEALLKVCLPLYEALEPLRSVVE